MKKFLAIIFTVMLCFVFETVAMAEEHTHCVCGVAACTGHTDGTIHNESITYDKILSVGENGIPSVDGVELECNNAYAYLPSGNYYVAEDCVPTVVSQKIIVIPEDATVNLCFGDYTFGSRLIKAKGKLNLCTCGIGTFYGAEQGVDVDGGVANIYNGKFTTSNAGIFVSNGGNVTIYDGTFEAERAAVVGNGFYTLTIYGGSFYSEKDSAAIFELVGDENIKLLGGTYTTKSSSFGAMRILDRHRYEDYADHTINIEISNCEFIHQDTSGEAIKLYEDGNFTPYCGITKENILADDHEWQDENGEAVDPTAVNYAKAVSKTGHYHKWSSIWSSDETAHWHECAVNGCNISDNTQKAGYATHTAPEDDGDKTTPVVCADCGYVFVAAEEEPEQPKPVSKPDPCDHDFDEDGVCKECGVKVISYTESNTTEETNPNTGAKNAVGIAAAVAAVSLIGIALSKKR